MDGAPVVIPGAKPRAILTMLGLHGGSVVPADVLMELLWGDDPPRTAAKALQTHISALRHALGDGFVLTEGTGWRLNTAETDASRYKSLAKSGRDALGAGDTGGAVTRFDEAVALWRGIPELPDCRRGVSEKTRWIEGHAALVEDRADALLATGRAAEIIGDLEAAVADAPLRERRWGQLMLALYRAGRQGEALGAYRRARSLLADELGVDPGPELRRLEAAIVAQDPELEAPATQHVPSVTRAVTFLLTDIEGSTAAWETDADAMALALARHDELVEQVVTSRGGRLIKTRGEGDATFSVFDRPSAAAAAAIELQDAIFHEPWPLAEPMRIRISLHTGEAELRDGDYFGRAVNRAARLRSQASGGQILCSGATAELVIDTLSDDVALVDLGMRQLKNLARPEHIFELRLQTAESPPPAGDTPIERPPMPAVLSGPGPFVGRARELAELLAAWHQTVLAGTRAVLIAGEPGVGKTRLAGEWGRQAYEQGAVVLYGRSDEDLGAPYQPFAEALRTLVPCIGTSRLRGLRGVEALLPLVPGLTDVLPDLAAPPHGDPDTERYALFDAVVALLGVASVEAPIVLVLDDLHWAAKPTLLLLRHLLRFGEHARVQIVGTYRSTDLDRSHPLAAMLADLHRDGSANRIALNGLDVDDVSTYVAEAGYDDEELARALASVTGGNPFFLIEALRHVDESGGHWDPSTLPQGVREAVSRRLSRLPVETNKALAAAAVVGSQFALELVEQVVGQDLVDAFDEACQAAILIEEPGGRYRFNHAIVRQSLLAELASVRRMRLHQRIAATLETTPGADDELLADLAHHYFECAWAGNALKAVEYCRRAADQAMTRLAYEGAADLYDHALHALEELDDELPDRDDQRVELLVARCEALLAAGDVSSAAGAVSQLKEGTRDSARLAAWATCFDGQLSMLVDPERLDDIESAVAAAAVTLAELGDAAGEAKAHTVRAGCLARLGRVADCELALDNALTAARQAREHRLVNAVLAGAPLAALWGPNPVPRAGGRCLDVVRLLRITTDSPAVEATSTRCQAVLEAFRGRAAAARRMIDSARRTVTELGLRHALLEVEHFAGIVELVLDDAAAADEHLRLAYNGFRRMRLDADTAEVAALLARACLALGMDTEADELCSESERLAGHALKPAIAWRTVRAQLLSRGGAHEEARLVAEEAVAIAERTDALVDHGDACLVLAAVLRAAGDGAGARVAAERSSELYEQKGAVALAEKARGLLGGRTPSAPTAPPESPVIEPNNACVRVCKQLAAAVEHEAWGDLEGLFAPGVVVESRRRIVGFTPINLPPRDWPREMRRYLELGMVQHRPVFVAARGERLALVRLSVGTDDISRGAPQDELFQVIGLDEDGLIALQVWFDIEDIDAALAELDAQYERFEALQQQSQSQVPQRYSDTACTRASKRAVAAIDAGAWDEFERIFAPEGYIESRRKLVGFERTEFSPHDVMHQTRCDLENGIMRAEHVILAVRGERLALARVILGTVDESPGAPKDEVLQVFGIDEDGRIALQIWFDVDDADAALAELDSLHARFEDERPRVSLANAATRADDRLITLALANRLDEIGALFTEDTRLDDRRQGFRCEINGRATAVDNICSIAALGVAVTKSTIAVRGDRLCLSRERFEEPAAYCVETLEITEVDSQGMMTEKVVFDLDDFDAALAELDARYLAGEAAPYAQTWAAVMGAYASFNRREVPATTADWVNIDNRRAAAFAPGDVVRFIQATWEDTPDTTIYIAAVHRLTEHGAIVTHVAQGTSQGGFEAEWRGLQLLAIDGEFLSRSELFDEEDLDVALAKLNELTRPTLPLGNAASRVYDRVFAYFASRDWTSMAEVMAEDILDDDRRRVANAGRRRGRDAMIANMRTGADLGARSITSTVIATRGDRLVLRHLRFSGQGPDAFHAELLGIAEINTDEQMVVAVQFDLDDIDDAFKELDARYLVGEASAHAHTWSAITAAYAVLNRRKLPTKRPNWIPIEFIDHRRIIAIEAGKLGPSLRAIWDITPDATIHIEAVHQLGDNGAVITQAGLATSRDGFQAEWRDICVLMVEGDLITRCELFDESELDAAVAKFDELSRPVRRLENAASRATDRFLERFAARDWDAMANMVIDDIRFDDRRRVINADLQTGRDTFIENFRIAADLGAAQTPTPIAIRGERVVLASARFSLGGGAPEEFGLDLLHVIEIDADNRIAATVTFDHNAFDAAIDELDARYLAGEAAPHAPSWSAIVGAYAALNRREMPATTVDHVSVDHRRVTSFAPGDIKDYTRRAWDQIPDISFRIEAVHRLNDHGAVVTHALRGTSREGFEAEWREIHLMTLDGELFNRSEMFDEDDLDSALARFDDLNRTAELSNAASRAFERFQKCLAEADLDAMPNMLSEDICSEDRRHIVSSGIRHGRDAALEDARVIAGLGAGITATTVLAIRGEHLALRHTQYAVGHEQADAYQVDLLEVVVVNTDERISAVVNFDPDDLDAAFAELDARYLAGDAASHAHTWSLTMAACAALNRHELPLTTADFADVDHRRAVSIDVGDMKALLRTALEHTPVMTHHVEAVHRLTGYGSVITQVAHGTSDEGFDAEWRIVGVLTIDGDLINRCEVFDEDDLDAALARFDELIRPVPRLENAASRLYAQFNEYLEAPDWDAMANMLADDAYNDDRRRVVSAGIQRGRDAQIANLRAVVDIGVRRFSTVVLATRGDRLALQRTRVSGADQPDPYGLEMLCVLEIGTDNRFAAAVLFDPDDLDAAFAELDARYLTGEAAAHAQTWSVIAGAQAAFKQHEVPATTPNMPYIDHRPVLSVDAVDLATFVGAVWDVIPNPSVYIEAVHRLSELGAVVTQVLKGTSPEGFDGEWRLIDLFTVEGDLISRCEVFDEDDLAAALARFDELGRPSPRLDSTATRIWARLADAFNRRDLAGLVALMTADGQSDDRRKGLTSSLKGGPARQKAMESAFAVAPKGLRLHIEPIATRGSRLLLTHDRSRDTNETDQPVTVELLTVIEADADGLIHDTVSFDLDDIDAAFEELDSRYLAGEAAAYLEVWSAITEGYAALNRHEAPQVTPDFEDVDHRHGVAFMSGDLFPYIHAAWDVSPDLKTHIETVHRLNKLGAVITQTAHGSSDEGFDAEWRQIVVFTVNGVVDRCEMFEEADLDAALARFDELGRPPST
ncbi:BTAD domain-containing putative transcriptional regulator [Mycolicibacterium septicum]|uniref:BTAD domain-containing putative transcriptional regulator n=1 Tax=Mycolicibacterium septicum TaxID=98668 RepID=UPI003B5C5B10